MMLTIFLLGVVAGFIAAGPEVILYLIRRTK